QAEAVAAAARVRPGAARGSRHRIIGDRRGVRAPGGAAAGAAQGPLGSHARRPGRRPRSDDHDGRRAHHAIRRADVVVTLLGPLTRARVFDLEQPRFAGMPVHPAHQPGYFYALHRRHRDSYRPDKYGPRSGSSGVLTMMEHSGTHIDALCHQAADLTFHGDVRVDDVERTDGFTQLGAETIRPLLGRGVLLDVAGWRQVPLLPQNYAITADDLEQCARASGVEVRAGDVLLVRTGYATCWNDSATYLAAAGVSKSGNLLAAAEGGAGGGGANLAGGGVT